MDLARDYQVIALDCRGHGMSDKPHQPEKYGREMSEDIARLLRHLQIPAAHIVGYSMGARIAGRFVVDHPEQVLCAVLGGAAPDVVGLPSPGAEMRRRTAESLEAGKGAGPLIEFLSPGGQPKPGAEQVEMANRFILAANDPLALAAIMRAMGDLAVKRESLKANSKPVLGIVGTLDPYLGAVKALASSMGNVEVSVIEGGSHSSVINQPSEFLSRARDFLKRHSAVSPSGRGQEDANYGNRGFPAGEPSLPASWLPCQRRAAA
jgi:pimeloyl-ACP methyl ester carboxylesterase